MAQIQGTDQHFIPRVDHYNQSGQIMAKGLADFGTGLGSAVKAFTVKQEEAKAEKQRSEGVADLLMQFYPGQFKDRKDAVKMAKDPDVTNAFFKFSQQQANADAAAAKVRQDLAQQSFENATKRAESQRAYQKLQSDTANIESQIRDREEDNVRADNQLVLPESNIRSLQQALALSKDPELSESERKDWRKLADTLNTEGSGTNLEFDGEGRLKSFSMGGDNRNTVSSQTDVQKRTKELDHSIGVGSSLLDEWNKNPDQVSGYFGFTGNAKHALFDETVLGEFGGANPKRKQFRERFNNFGTAVKDANAPDRRLLAADNEILVAGAPIYMGLFDGNPVTVKASIEEGMKAIRFKRSILQAHSFMPDAQIAFSDMTDAQIANLPGLTDEEKTDILIYLGK